MLMNSEESETVKYAANCFFATKVSFFNEIKLLSDKLNCDFNKIMDGVLADGRIGVSHYQVPAMMANWVLAAHVSLKTLTPSLTL